MTEEEMRDEIIEALRSQNTEYRWRAMSRFLVTIIDALERDHPGFIELVHGNLASLEGKRW